ncbi:MAG: phosphatidylserine decarboxylase [Defluviitaleaceae bacterium]|nr:phosphatidylserine decarboxylase [Defluviitaleaceae bacterium]MCL2262325.1 phosphatidylserine decarboxylase [Defluviitaleaceae bacterium]
MKRIQLRSKFPKLPKRKIKLREPKARKRQRKQPIWIYNEGQLEQEKICPERLMRLIYENPVGGAGLLWLVKRKAVSRLYGLYCRTPLSAKGIPQFIEKYGVDMTGCHGTYKNFAQFFAREKTGVEFPQEDSVLGSPCEGLVSIFSDIKPEQIIAAKGTHFSLEELFADADLAQEYSGGTMVSIRLTPANYHRMHFFDAGVITATRLIKGDLYSVSPLALNRVVKLYCRNKRALIQFSTENFGDAVLVEVGATFVGSIVHCFEDGDHVQRGDVASYFKPGGSLVLLFLKKDTFIPNNELLLRTIDGIETKVPIGESLGAN